MTAPESAVPASEGEAGAGTCSLCHGLGEVSVCVERGIGCSHVNDPSWPCPCQDDEVPQ